VLDLLDHPNLSTFLQDFPKKWDNKVPENIYQKELFPKNQSSYTWFLGLYPRPG